MRPEVNVAQRLRILGSAVSPDAAFVDEVMSRVAQARIAPARSAVSRRWSGSLFQSRRLAVAACLIALAILMTWPFGIGSRTSSNAWWLGEASAYAQELKTVLDKALAGVVTGREQVTAIMRDGSQHVSSTNMTLFLSGDRYRRDICEGDTLRETQWYVPNSAGMTQTSIRFDSGTYSIDKHPAPPPGDKVASLRAIVQFIGKADHRLDLTQIEGRKCVGFEIRAEKLDAQADEGTCRVWFDVNTRLPVRVETILESTRRDSTLQIQGTIFTLDHIDWNPRLPSNTFTPYIPDGFKQSIDK